MCSPLIDRFSTSPICVTILSYWERCNSLVINVCCQLGENFIPDSMCRFGLRFNWIACVILVCIVLYYVDIPFDLVVIYSSQFKIELVVLYMTHYLL